MDFLLKEDKINVLDLKRVLSRLDFVPPQREKDRSFKTRCSLDLQSFYENLHLNSSASKKSVSAVFLNKSSKRLIFQILWSVNSQSFLSFRDLNSLILEKEVNEQKRFQLIKAYDINRAFTPYEILCVLEGDLLLSVIIDQEKISEPFPLAKAGISKVRFLCCNPYIPGNFALGTRGSMYVFQLNKAKKPEIEDQFAANADLASFSPNGKVIVTLNKLEFQILIYNFLEKKSFIEKLPFLVDSMEFSPSGVFLAVYSIHSNQVLIFETCTWNSQCFQFNSTIETVAWDYQEMYCNVLCADSLIYRMRNHNNFSLSYQDGKGIHRSNDAFSLEEHLKGGHVFNARFVFLEDLYGIFLVNYLEDHYEIDFLAFRKEHFRQEKSGWKGLSLHEIGTIPNYERNEIREIFFSANKFSPSLDVFVMFSDLKLKRFSVTKPRQKD